MSPENPASPVPPELAPDKRPGEQPGIAPVVSGDQHATPPVFPVAGETPVVSPGDQTVPEPRTGWRHKIAEGVRVLGEVAGDFEVTKSLGRTALALAGLVIPFVGYARMLPGIRTKTAKETREEIKQKPWTLLPGVAAVRAVAAESRVMTQRFSTARASVAARRAADRNTASTVS